MADFRTSIAVRRAMGDAATALVDSAGGAGRLDILAGTRPAGPDVVLTTQSLLARLEMAVPAFAPTDANGIAIANPILADTDADATGSASFFRITDAAGVALFQGDVSATGGGGDLQLNAVVIQAGVEVGITSLSITLPEA